jgi:putative addiction module killer protein
VKLEIYQDQLGRQPFVEWLYALKDLKTKARIESRVRRLSLSNWGDYRLVGEGVIELRLDFGPGYRVYCSRTGRTVVLLLLGGDKRTQRRDIETAK